MNKEEIHITKWDDPESWMPADELAFYKKFGEKTTRWDQTQE